MTSNLTRRTSPPKHLDDIVRQASDAAGIPAGTPQLLRHFANAVYLLPEADVVARVAYGPRATERSRTAVAVTRWLVTNNFPATEPVALPSSQDQPIPAGRDGQEVAVTFWRHYPQPPTAQAPPVEILAAIACELHQRHGPPPVPLAPYQPLRSLTAVLADPASQCALDEATHAWLVNRVGELRDGYARLDFPIGTGLIHADFYSGNLLWDTRFPGDHVVLGDWDSVCIGPREVDLLPTYAATRFGLAPTVVDRFATAYGHDLRTWSGYPTLRSIRELSTLTALVRLAPTRPASSAELQHRLASLRNHDTAALWHGQ